MSRLIKLKGSSGSSPWRLVRKHNPFGLRHLIGNKSIFLEPHLFQNRLPKRYQLKQSQTLREQGTESHGSFVRPSYFRVKEGRVAVGGRVSAIGRTK